MSDVLSQAEIDALLAAFSSGEMDVEAIKEEEEKGRIRQYDFKRALRFSKDQIRSLTRIHENFARLLTTHYSTMLRTYVHIEVASVDQLPFEEFIRSVATSTIVGVFSAEPLKGRYLYEIHPSVAYAMLDRFLGGPGRTNGGMFKWTEIEQSIIERLLRRSREAMRESWQQMVEIDPELEEVETNPQFLQIVSPNEIVAVITFTAKVGEGSGMINLCIPHMMLEPLMSKLSAHHMLSKAQKELSPREREELLKRIHKSEVPLRVMLGEATLTLRELVELSPGDVIRLGTARDAPLPVFIDHRPKFLARPGKVKKRLAVIIERILEEGEKGV